MKRYIHAATEEILAMATVGRHFKPNFTVVVTPDTSRQGVCYFKYLDSESYRTAESIAGVNIRKPERIYHKDATGKQEWQLSHKDKKALCKFLDSNSKYKGATNWDLVLYHWNNENGFLEEDYGDRYSSPVEAFVDGFFDSEDNVADPSYVPSYVVRPDYLLLPNE